MNEYNYYSYDDYSSRSHSTEFRLTTKKIKKLWNHAKKYGSKSEQLEYQIMYQESIKH